MTPLKKRILLEYLSYMSVTSEIVMAIGVITVLYVLFATPLRNKSRNTLTASIITGVILIWRFGCQPIGWGLGGDREAYSYALLLHPNQSLSEIFSGNDPVFNFISSIIYKASDLDTYFIVIATIYVTLYFFFCRRAVDNNQYWLFVTIILSSGFINYGYNTIRAGLAFAIFLFAITFRRKLVLMCTLLLLAAGIHFSLAIPIMMFLISRYFAHTRIFFALWILSVPVSYLAGDFFNQLFSQFSEDQRVQYLVTKKTIYKTGFRIDFIVYSFLPIIVGYYYIFVRKFKSVWYKSVYNTYILTNIFWILVITSNFSDRFAYLSWFLIPVILVYPILVNYKIVRKPNYWLAGILLEEIFFKLLF